MINEITFPGLGLSFTLNRAAFSVFGLPIYWYGLLIAFGMVLAGIYGYREAKKTELGQDDFLNMLLIAVPASIVCARLYYVLFNLDTYRVLNALDIRSGGLAIYGGIIGACIVVVSYCRAKHLSIGITVDILAVGLLIGQVIGRWGNFINGEAFGSVTNLPWAMTVKTDGSIVALNVHPTFIYESLWNFVGIGVLLLYKRIKKFNGELLCAYMVWYGMGRAWIEGLRADSLYIGSYRVSQLLAIATVILGFAIIIYGRIKVRKQNIQ